MYRLTILLFALVLVPVTGAASPETHYVGIYEGLEETNGRIHGPEARVSIDRPGAEVVLILADYGPVRWQVDVSPRTTISELIIAGYRPERSEVLVNGVPFAGAKIDESLADPHDTVGRPFRELVAQLSERDDLPDLISFNGGYRPPEAGFVIDPSSAPTPVLSTDYLASFVRPERLTPSLRAAMTPGRGEILRFEDDGFALVNADEPDKGLRFPVSLDVPEISWPVAAAIDTQRDLFYGISLGGEGFLYAFDRAQAQWSVRRSMDGFDADGMIYDAARDRLIVVGERWDEAIIVTQLDPVSGAEISESLRIPFEDLHGFTDLYDVGNGPRPPLLPVVVDGELLLLQSGAHWTAPENAGRRSYVLDLASGQFDLIDYRD